MNSKIWSVLMSHKKVTIPLIIFMLFLIILPMAIKYAAIDWLEDNGAKNVVLNDVDLNIFAGTFGIQGFSIQENERRKLSLSSLKLNCSMLALLRKRILVESLIIDGLDIAAEQTQGQLQLGMPLPPGQKTEHEQATGETPQKKAIPLFGVKTFSLLNSNISFHRIDLSGNAAIKDLKLKNLISWTPDSTARLSAEMRLNNSPFSVDAQMNLFSPEKHVDAKIGLEKFSLAPFGNLAATFVNDLQGVINMKNRLLVSMSEDGSMRIEHTGSLSIEDLKGMLHPTEGQQVQLLDLDLGWQGSSQVDLSPTMRPIAIDALGELSNDHLMVALLKPKANLEHTGIHIPVSIAIDSLEDLNTLNATVNFNLAGLLFASDELGIDILSLDGLEIASIGMKGLSRIEVATILAKELAIASPHKTRHPSIPASLIRNQKIQVSGIRVNDLSNITIDDVDIHEFAASIYRNKDGEFPLVTRLAGIVAPQKEAGGELQPIDKEKNEVPAKNNQQEANETLPEAMQETEGKQPLGIKIGTFFFSGNSTIDFTDESLDPRFERQINIDELSVKNIDNSDIRNSADLLLSLKVDKYASIQTKGKIRPFHPKVDLDLDATISNVHLPPISPYLSKYLGYNIKTGVLTLDSVFKVDAGILDSDNEIVLKNIKLTPDDQEKIDQLSKQLTMPLDSALSILRDKNNDVRLSLPITGDIKDPDFNLNDIMVIAMGKALKMASVSVVKHLLQPYGALVTIANLIKKGGEYLMEIKLDPIGFDTGSAELTGQAKSYLATVKNLLSEKQEMRLTICGLSTPGDLPELTIEENKDAFLSLAEQRSLIIQDYFVTQGISIERLFVCNPELDMEVNAQPKATLSL